MKYRRIVESLLISAFFFFLCVGPGWSEDAGEPTGGAVFTVGAFQITDAAIKLDSGFNYQGRLNAAGQPEGIGRAEYTTGEYPGLYYGNFANGKRDGYGQFLGKNTLYLGEWQDDIPRGNGVIFFANGDIYSGEHLRLQPDGWQGGMLYADGTMYLGPWSKGKYYSWGTLVTNDGNLKKAWRSNGVTDNMARSESATVPAVRYETAPVYYDLSTRAGEWEYYKYFGEMAKELTLAKEEMDKYLVLERLSKDQQEKISSLGVRLLEIRNGLRRSQIKLDNSMDLTVDRHTQWARFRLKMILSADRVLAQWIALSSYSSLVKEDNFSVEKLVANPEYSKKITGLIFVNE